MYCFLDEMYDIVILSKCRKEDYIVAIKTKSSLPQEQKKSESYKKSLDIEISTNEWDIEEIFRNVAGTFGVFRAKRDGFLSYEFIVFEKDLRVLDDENTKINYILLSLGYSKDKEGKWRLRLVGEISPL